MDGALFSLLFFFFVQISAGVAPMRWPECKWLAGVIFWISTAGAVGCLIWYSYSQGWVAVAHGMIGLFVGPVVMTLFVTLWHEEKLFGPGVQPA